jgi:hypothetical protein
MAQKSTESESAVNDEAIAAAGSAASDTPEMTSEHRDEMASKLIERFAIWSGVAGLIPVPVVDVVTVGGLQLQMLRRLSQIYGVPFSENRGKALIASLAGSMIPATSGIGASNHRTIVSSSRLKRNCGIHEPAEKPRLLNLVLPKRPRGRRQPVLDSRGRMPAHRGVVTQAPQLSTGESEPHARIHYSHSFLRSHRIFRLRPPNGLYRDISSCACHHCSSGASCAATARPITPRRMGRGT